MSGPDQAPVLFNATYRRIAVRVGGRVVALPRVRVPQLLSDVSTDGEGGGELVLQVPPADPAAGDGGADEVAGQGFTVRVGSGITRTTMDLPDEQPGVFYLVDRDILVRLPHRRDLLSPASYEVVPPLDPADDLPAAMVLYNAYRSLDAVGPQVENVNHPADWQEFVAKAIREQVRVRGLTPPPRWPDPWQDPRPVEPGDVLDVAVEGDNETEEQLRGRLGDHPDVAVLLAMRRRHRAVLISLFGAEEPDPDYSAWVRERYGIDASPAARRAHADEMVDALLGTTADAAARRQQVARAAPAAAAWALAVTGHPPAGVLAGRLRETAVRLRAGLDDRDPAATLVRLVIEAVEKGHHRCDDDGDLLAGSLVDLIENGEVIVDLPVPADLEPMVRDSIRLPVTIWEWAQSEATQRGLPSWDALVQSLLEREQADGHEAWAAAGEGLGSDDPAGTPDVQ